MQPGLGGHEMLGLYAEAIERMDQNAGIPQLFRDIFSNAFLPYRDPETLRVFLKVIDGFNYDNSERLGDAFEYLLSVMDSQGERGAVPHAAAHHRLHRVDRGPEEGGCRTRPGLRHGRLPHLLLQAYPDRQHGRRRQQPG